MSYPDHWLENLRLCALKELSKLPGTSGNTSLLHVVAEKKWGFHVTRSQLNAELDELERLGALQIINRDGDVLVASLTQRGLDHVERRLVLPGVKQPALG